MNDKFAPLGDDEAAQKTPAGGDEWTPVVPVPDGAPKAPAAIDAFARFKGMSKTGLWQYTNAENKLLAFTARFDHPPNGKLGEKEFRQFTFCGNASGRREWRCKSLPPPRPLFGLARLAENPGLPVLIVEGERTAAAAATFFPGHVVVTSSHGAKSAKTADWLPLAGREAVIWPDRDMPGDGYAADVAALVSKSGARSVRIVTVPPDFPDGWDLADKVPEGADLRALLHAAASWRNGPDARAQKAATLGTKGGDFLAAYQPISYTIEGVLPSGSIYGLTARQGTGKTAFLITASLAIMKGNSEVMGGEVERGRVAYVTKENPDDFRMKLAVNCYLHGIDHNFLNEWMLVLDGRDDPPESIREALQIDAKLNGQFQLICYDTFQAGYAASGGSAGAGDAFNSNDGVLKFVARLRKFTEIIGRPSGLVAFHPTKNATEEELVPYGGGSIMNEIDGNLTLWAEAPYQIKLGWNRVRGPQFEPRHFRIEKLSCPDIVDKKGREILLPVLRSSTAQDVDERGQAEVSSELALLRAIIANPDATQAEWGMAIGQGKGRVNHKLQKLKQLKLVEEGLGKWRVTAKGFREAS